MASFTFSLFFTTTTLAILFLGASLAEAKFKGINPWCKTADYKYLCTLMVGNATSQNDALIRAVDATILATEKVFPNKDGNLAIDIPSEVKDTLGSTCRECLERALDNLKDVKSYMVSNDMPTVLDRIQTAGSSYVDCGDAMKETVKVPQLERATKFLFKFASNCMAVATQM